MIVKLAYFIYYIVEVQKCVTHCIIYLKVFTYKIMNCNIHLFFSGVIVLIVPPETDDLNNTLPETEEFPNEVFPKDARESTDPTSIGMTFTASEDESVFKYGKCGMSINFSTTFAMG